MAEYDIPDYEEVTARVGSYARSLDETRRNMNAILTKGIKIHRRQTIFNVQAFVGDNMVFHGDVIGVSMHRPAEGSK